MQQSPIEIKEKLLKALDSQYNVVDMATVLEIVTILEKTPITKEALETTRLGRDINELRRKTKNESLAKRAKELVRRWRDLILPPSTNNNNNAAISNSSQNSSSSFINDTDINSQQHNGSSGASTPRPSSRTGTDSIRRPVVSPAISDRSSLVSPGLASFEIAVPKTHASNKRLRKSGMSTVDPSPVTSPNSTESSKVLISSPQHKKSRLDDDFDAKPSSTRLNGQYDDDSKQDWYNSSVSEISSAPVQLDSQTSSPTASIMQALIHLPKKRGRKKLPRDKAGKVKHPKKAKQDIVKEKIASIARVPKVKTTQELIASLQSTSHIGLTPSNVADDTDVALNKTEHIARFLRSTAENNDETDDIEETDSLNITHDSEDVQSVEHNQNNSFLSAEDLLARLPPLNLDAIQWSSDEDDNEPNKLNTVRNTAPVGVDSILTQQIENINGNIDRVDNTFKEWHEVFTTTSYNGDLLHVLPYVIID